MGYYEGLRDNPCPRCGGIVYTVFISVSPMSFSQRCQKCGITEFTEAEELQLGGNSSRLTLETINDALEKIWDDNYERHLT